MKKALAILVAVMMLATICMTASAGSCTMAFADVEVEEGTATVNVPLNITANEGIWSCMINASFDTSKLEFVSAAAAGEGFNLLANQIADDTIKLLFDAKDMADVTDTGAIATLTFKVTGAVGDVAAVTANLPDPDSNINVDSENVALTVNAGSVKIIEKAVPSTEPTNPSTEPSTEPTDPVEPTDPTDPVEPTDPTNPTEPSNTPATQATTTPTVAPTNAPANNNGGPSTGSVIPAAAVVLASASAAVLCFARKK